MKRHAVTPTGELFSMRDWGDLDCRHHMVQVRDREDDVFVVNFSDSTGKDSQIPMFVVYRDWLFVTAGRYENVGDDVLIGAALDAYFARRCQS